MKDFIQGFITAILAATVVAGTALLLHETLNNTDEINTDEATRIVETGTEPHYYEVEMNVSGYCTCSKCCGVWAEKGVDSKGTRITASGKPAKGKLIAAPRNYAFGTKMDVPGYGEAIVLDRGGVITDNRIDLLFSTHQEALNFGRQNLTVKVYR